jgi:hypothetical protein
VSAHRRILQREKAAGQQTERTVRQRRTMYILFEG